MKQALIQAFKSDLPKGFALVESLVNKLKAVGNRAMEDHNPNSEEGRQYMRLLAPDVPRAVLEEHFGCAFGFYNCCKGVAAERKDLLNLSLREQIAAQDPKFANC